MKKNSGLVRYFLAQHAVVLAGALILFVAASYVVRPHLPVSWRLSSSDGLYALGVIGAILLLAPVVYSWVKRGPSVRSPRPWMIIHIVATVTGAVLITIHSGGHWGRPPALLVLLVYFLILQGAWARSVGAAKLSQVMATRREALTEGRRSDRTALAAILQQKRDLLKRLDSGADEAVFSPNRRHWLRHPVLSCSYIRLAAREARLIGARATVDRGLQAWRRLHLAAAAILVGGIVIHVVTVTFFAGYVAEGRPITWWHLAAWGG